MIVLDTHVWVWWRAEPAKLSRRARAAIDAEPRLGLCPISCWEVATKVVKGKLALDRDLRVWIKQALAHPRLSLLPIDQDISVDAALLGDQGFHGDPADRLIAATAKRHKSELVTKDKALRAHPAVATIW